jgi:F-type H+-transporting ATPase subunit b
MLEFTQWYFVLVANFIILLIVLNAILFKPLAKVFKEREGAIKGALDEAKNLTTKKDEAIVRMNAELSSARSKAKETFNALREEGLANQKASMSKAETEAVAMIEKARGELKVETEKARAALKADVDRFSEEIVKKLVKV